MWKPRDLLSCENNRENHDESNSESILQNTAGQQATNEAGLMQVEVAA